MLLIVLILTAIVRAWVQKISRDQDTILSSCSLISLTIPDIEWGSAEKIEGNVNDFVQLKKWRFLFKNRVSHFSELLCSGLCSDIFFYCS